MDAGIFLVSGRRLKAWLILPPILIASVGLGSYAWQQQAEWQLKKAEALSDILPEFIKVREEAVLLVESLHTSVGGELASRDQLGSFLQDMAKYNDFKVATVDIIGAPKSRQNKVIPVLHAMVRGHGDFLSTELYINKVKTEQRLLSVNSIVAQQPEDDSKEGVYDVTIVFELLILDDMAVFNGEAR